MLKKLLIINLILLSSLFGYISIDGGESTTGTLPSEIINDAIGGTCVSNCSDIWRYNATTTLNLIENNPEKFVNPEIWSSNKLKVEKNITPSQFIEKGIEFFKNNQNKDGLNLDVFIAVREIPEITLKNKETITKSANDFSLTDINKENVARYVNNDTVFNSFLFGMLEINTGLINAYVYRNRILKINNKKYHFIELEKVNFLNSLVNRYNKYCSNPENYHFPFIYEPTNFFYSYQEKLSGTNFDILNPNNIYPDNIYKNGTKSGLISLPCDSTKIGDNPYEAIKNIKIFLDPNKVTYFDKNDGFNKDDLIENVENYFYDNGYSLKIAMQGEKRMLQIATSFFSAIMQEDKIESGMIIKTKEAKIKNNYWKVGKCPTHYNKKTINLSSETYFLSSLVYDMPFSEAEASFNPLNSTEISLFSPIPAFPAEEETLYAFTPDNHVLSHSINKNNPVIGDIFTGTAKSFPQTREYHQKCKSFGFLSFILVIVFVVIAIYTLGSAFTTASSMSGALHISTISAFSYVAPTAVAAFFGVSNLTVILVSSLMAYNFYSSIWTGVDTPPTSTELAKHSFIQKMEMLQQADAVSSGSKIYLGFTNLKKTLNSSNVKQLGITPKSYTDLTDNSFMYDQTAINGYNNQILGFNTESSLNSLYAMTFSHSEPPTFPQNFRYYKYTRLIYDPQDIKTYQFKDLKTSPVNVSAIENSLLNDMYGYSSGQLDVFNTREVMKEVLDKLDGTDFSKYEQ